MKNFKNSLCSFEIGPRSQVLGSFAHKIVLGGFFSSLSSGLRQRIKLLESFEGKINNLEQQIEYLSCKEIMLCKETQTVSNLEFKCEECNFESETEKELAWHMGKHHGWPSDQKTEDMDISCSSQGVRYCVLCDYEAEDMYDLEAHTWSEHEEVSIVDHKRLSLEVDDQVKEPNVHQNVFSCEFFETERSNETQERSTYRKCEYLLEL